MIQAFIARIIFYFPLCKTVSLKFIISKCKDQVPYKVNLTTYIKPITSPPTAPIITTIQGGSFQKTSMLNKTEAKAKSSGARMDEVQMGW